MGAHMDASTFDRLSRLWGASGSRRAALGTLLATGAILGGTATLEGTAAKRRRRGGVQAAQATVVPCPGPPTLRDCATRPIGPGVNLEKCDLTNRDFRNANLRSANLTGASFFLAEFFGEPVSFRGANASQVCFGQAELDFADFRGANVSHSNFCGARLRGADFRGSNVTAEQLACALVTCNTILPNGKPAVTCAAGRVCCGAVCCDAASCEDDTCRCGSGPGCGDGQVCVTLGTEAACGTPCRSAADCPGCIACTAVVGGSFCTGSLLGQTCGGGALCPESALCEGSQGRCIASCDPD
jgi:uncharacterized protein YjbI with pentapeptide repeats